MLKRLLQMITLPFAIAILMAGMLILIIPSIFTYIFWGVSWLDLVDKISRPFDWATSGNC